MNTRFEATVKLLTFDMDNFTERKKISYIEEREKFKRKQIITTLIAAGISSALMVILCFDFISQHFLAFSILLPISIILLNIHLVHEQMYDYDVTHTGIGGYATNFVERLKEGKIIFAQIENLEHLMYSYSKDGAYREAFFYELSIQQRTDINDLWLDLEKSRLYVPYNKYKEFKNTAVTVDLTFSENPDLMNLR